jgi:serine/threonine protein kinase
MRFGRFVVDPKKVKEGGQALVYLTADPIDGERVAIKVARPSEWSRKRMKREIKTQRSLNHPNVLPILEHAASYDWYAMAQAECSLDEFGPFPRAQWMHFRAGMLGVASAVAHAHSKGLVHRDLSPGNVLVFAGGWAVSDWGFVYLPSKTGPRMTRPLERFGTPEFMAPEQVIDPRYVGPPADIYALGRIAAWGTMVKEGEGNRSDDHPFTAWWRLLIDNTTACEPARRWTIRDVQTHLRSLPSRHVQLRFDEPSFDAPLLISRMDVCPHCRRDAGRDRSEHCLGCHAPLPY